MNEHEESICQAESERLMALARVQNLRRNVAERSEGPDPAGELRQNLGL